MPQARLKLTTLQAVRLQKTIRTYADIMGLLDWSILFDSRPVEDEEAEAEINCPESKHALIRLCPQFLEFEPAYQARILCHELCHLYILSLDDVVSSIAPDDEAAPRLGVLSKEAFNVFYYNYETHIEMITDWLTRVMVEQLPLPRLGSRRQTRVPAAPIAPAHRRRQGNRRR